MPVFSSLPSAAAAISLSPQRSTSTCAPVRLLSSSVPSSSSLK